MGRFIFVLPLLLFGVAMAQEPTTDPSSWFGSTAALAAVIASVVQVLKNLVPQIKGVVTLLVSGIVGIALALVGNGLGLLPGSLGEVLIFGVTAAAVASGLKGTLNSFAAKVGNGGPPTPPSSGTLPG